MSSAPAVLSQDGQLVARRVSLSQDRPGFSQRRQICATVSPARPTWPFVCLRLFSHPSLLALSAARCAAVAWHTPTPLCLQLRWKDDPDHLSVYPQTTPAPSSSKEGEMARGCEGVIVFTVLPTFTTHSWNPLHLTVETRLVAGLFASPVTGGNRCVRVTAPVGGFRIAPSPTRHPGLATLLIC